MSNRPLISVIVPVYNVQQWLPFCLKSVAAQTYDALEILFINDGSTDGSEKEVAEFSATYSYARVIHQPHSGLAAARATGVKQARGEYITFVDGDDEISPNYITALYTATQFTRAPLTVAPLIKFSGEIPTPFSVPPLFYSGELSGQNRIKIFEDGSSAMALCGKLIARELADKLVWQASALSNAEDIAPAAELISRADKIAFAPNAHYFYRQRENSQSHSGPACFSGLAEGFLQAKKVLKQNGTYADFAPGFEYVCRVALCSFMEKYGITRHEEDFLHAHRDDLQVPKGTFAGRPFKFRLRQYLFEKSLDGKISYVRLMRFLRRLFRRA